MGDKPGKKQTKRQQKKAPQEPNQQRLNTANHNSRRALRVVDDCIFDELGHLQKGLLLLVEDTPVTFLPDLPPAKEYEGPKRRPEGGE
jgi:hypothetical protein